MDVRKYKRYPYVAFNWLFLYVSARNLRTEKFDDQSTGPLENIIQIEQRKVC